MDTVVCRECGERNDVETAFCVHCGAYLHWNTEDAGRSQPTTQRAASPVGTPREQGPRAEPATETTAIRAPERPGPDSAAPGPPDSAGGRFRLRVDDEAVSVPATGEPVTVPVRIVNTSSVVDGYRVIAPGAPAWLIVESGPLQLMPGTQEVLPVQLRISSPTLVPAQQRRTVLRVQSTVSDSAQVETALQITVPVVHAPVLLRPEPQLVRVRDQDTAACVIIVDNARSNRAVRLTFSGSDPELAVRFTFEPATLEVGPGASASVRAIATARGPEPGREMSRVLTVIADDGDQLVETQLTLQQSTSAADPPVELEVVPSLVRLHDADSAQVRVMLDNRKGRTGVRLWLGGRDPERVINFTYTSPVVDVAAGQVLAVDLRLDSPRPEAGQERARPFTVTASDGRRTVETAASLVQVTSRAAIETLSVHLDPSVLHLGSRRRGSLTAVVDNRAGSQPARVAVHGDDPRNVIRFDFSPQRVEVPPGQTAATVVRVRGPRPQTGREVTLPFDVIASDGRSEVRSEGSLIQAAADWRPLLRGLFTLLGGLAMILGAFLPVRAGDPTRAADFSAALVGDLFGFNADLAGFEQMLSVGLVMVILGVLVMIGLAGAKGRLSRGMAVLGLMVIVALLVAIGFIGLIPVPGLGTIVMVLGCIAGYVGGRLIKQ